MDLATAGLLGLLQSASPTLPPMSDSLLDLRRSVLQIISDEGKTELKKIPFLTSTDNFVEISAACVYGLEPSEGKGIYVALCRSSLDKLRGRNVFVTSEIGTNPLGDVIELSFFDWDMNSSKRICHLLGTYEGINFSSYSASRECREKSDYHRLERFNVANRRRTALRQRIGRDQ